jgi:hypothetical protein
MVEERQLDGRKERIGHNFEDNRWVKRRREIHSKLHNTIRLLWVQGHTLSDGNESVGKLDSGSLLICLEHAYSNAMGVAKIAVSM